VSSTTEPCSLYQQFGAKHKHNSQIFKHTHPAPSCYKELKGLPHRATAKPRQNLPHRTHPRIKSSNKISSANTSVQQTKSVAAGHCNCLRRHVLDNIHTAHTQKHFAQMPANQTSQSSVLRHMHTHRTHTNPTSHRPRQPHNKKAST
jgi:hypothetical protein